ncbi:MAG: hypothetical protein [Bacteriophage sp.]|nr:MAG: hypothetical protein [Bacteriophage sp.]
MRAKFYDNGTSIEIGISASDKSILYFESIYEESELPAYIVELSKKEVEELIDFLKRKLEEME